MTDLCLTCPQNTTKLQWTGNLLDPMIFKNQKNQNQTVPSLAASVLYSFDYVQQVDIPTDPISFQTPTKCVIFGVMHEGMPQQVQYSSEMMARETKQGSFSWKGCQSNN